MNADLLLFYRSVGEQSEDSESGKFMYMYIGFHLGSHMMNWLADSVVDSSTLV